MIQEKLTARKLPELLCMNDGSPVKTPDDWRLRRRELLELLSREVYGFTPAAPETVEGLVEKSEKAFAGKAVQEKIQLSFDTPGGRFTFPFVLITPVSEEKVPVFVNVNFRPEIPDKYLPAEEIIDHGFAVATFYYQDVTQDGPEWDGIAALYPRDEKTGWGKIGMWAFAASRILDYLEQREHYDLSRTCVCGHSRLGKTALWCGAQDERFAMVVSNDSGCSGAAITRDKVGENVKDIITRFPYWFCGNYHGWAGREHEMPFEQHMLLALAAPRKLYVCSATEDEWADPESEYLCCFAASPAWKLLRVPGFIAPNALPTPDEPLHEGGICYHLRTGGHFFSRTDWLWHMACRERYHI